MLILEAPAKLNLFLQTTGKREDGYHLIDTVMHSVNLYDTVFIEKSSEILVRCGDLPQEENIAYKAARLFFEHTEIQGGCEINIEKNKYSPKCRAWRRQCRCGSGAFGA